LRLFLEKRFKLGVKLSTYGLILRVQDKKQKSHCLKQAKLLIKHKIKTNWQTQNNATQKLIISNIVKNIKHYLHLMRIFKYYFSI